MLFLVPLLFSSSSSKTEIRILNCTDSLDIHPTRISSITTFAVAEKEVSWVEQQKRLKEVMPWANNKQETEESNERTKQN